METPADSPAEAVRPAAHNCVTLQFDMAYIWPHLGVYDVRLFPDTPWRAVCEEIDAIQQDLTPDE